jgi:hypothetical protein
VSHIAIEAGPVAYSVEGFKSALDAWVSCNGDVMVVMDDLGPEGSTRNAQAVSVIHEELVGREGIVLKEGGGNAGHDLGALQSAEDGAKVGVRGELLFDLIFEFGG